MTVRLPFVLPATLGAAALVAALLPMTTAHAEPAGSDDPAATIAVTDVDAQSAIAPGAMSLVMSRSFVKGLAANGVRVEPVGTTTRSGRTLSFPVYAPSAGPNEEIVSFTGGLALRAKSGRHVRCDSLALVRSTGELLCGRGDRKSPRFSSLRMLQVRGDLVTVDTAPDQVVRSATQTGAPAAMARINRALGVKALTAGQSVGRIALTLGTAPVRASRDSRSSCDIDDWAGDTSINRGWAIQALVNRIPKGITVSQFDTTTGRAPTPEAAPVAVGQRTPFMEGIGVTESKRIIRGSEYNTDKFWNGPTYGCNNWAPYVVGQGGLDEQGVQAWNYLGEPRGGASDPARSRTQWWGHARQTNYDGPTGQYSWTCRGLPTDEADTYWGRKSEDPGFEGDTSSRNAGRAPECRDENMAGFTLTTRYSISKRGGLEARDDQATYPRNCSVEGNGLIGCWQEIYPLEWDRAWGFQYHVYASALRAVLDADTRIRLSGEFADIPGTVRPLAWRISDGDVSGAWPDFTDDNGARRDMSGVATPLNRQNLAAPSPFTIPAGLKDTFTLAGYGTPMGNQQMTFLLTGDTDGTWTWPTSRVDGRPLPRPQVRITLGYTISNFDNGQSCQAKIWYDDKAFGSGRGNDKSGPHCIEGQVPTIWPLPENSGKLWQRQIDDFITDKDGKRVRNTPTTTFDATVLASCFNKAELTVQDNSVKSAPVVGADYTWNIRLAGTFTQLSGC
jgi:hypothetical protein